MFYLLQRATRAAPTKGTQVTVNPLDMPAVTVGAIVTQAHADYCAENGHATHRVNGVVSPFCPRCGDAVQRDSSLYMGCCGTTFTGPDPELMHVDYHNAQHDAGRREARAYLADVDRERARREAAGRCVDCDDTETWDDGARCLTCAIVDMVAPGGWADMARREARARSMAAHPAGKARPENIRDTFPGYPNAMRMEGATGRGVRWALSYDGRTIN